jgi:hypothetical protein
MKNGLTTYLTCEEVPEVIPEVISDDVIVDLPTTFYNLQAQYLQESYVEGMQLYKKAFYKDQRKWLMEGLLIDYKEAKKLLANHKEKMNDTAKSQLKLILSRPPKDLKNGGYH